MAGERITGELNDHLYYVARLQALRAKAAKAQDPDIARTLDAIASQYERLACWTETIGRGEEERGVRQSAVAKHK